jgi:hypothetical protein
MKDNQELYLGKLAEVYRKNKHTVLIRDAGHFRQKLGFFLRGPRALWKTP